MTPRARDLKRARDKAYRDRNPEKRRLLFKVWCDNNQGKRRASSKAYYEANKEKVKLANKAYYEANRGSRDSAKKVWRAANREKENASGRARANKDRGRYRTLVAKRQRGLKSRKRLSMLATVAATLAARPRSPEDVTK